MPDVTPELIAALAAVAFVAGAVDAVAGGGGLLTVPALLSAGLPPHLALGTNKGSAVFGSFASFLGFLRAGLIDRRRALTGFPLGFAGSLGGAALVLLLPPETLRPLALALLLGVAVFFAFRRGPAPRAGTLPRWRLRLVGLGAALLIGAYDGFFGPGTGTFLITAYVAGLGDPPLRASANAKVVNFASNLAAALLFAQRGAVLWALALPMAVGQFAGGVVGARLTIAGGDRLVRRVVLVVVAALVLKLGSDFHSGTAVPPADAIAGDEGR